MTAITRLDRAARAYPVREENEFFTISAPIALQRYCVMEMGRRLVEKGIIQQVDDIFFLEMEEARAALGSIDDMRALVTRLTDRFEDNRVNRWRISDAPAAFIEKQLAAIVGIEIELTKLVGKWKVSQNRTADDRAGVARGLAESGEPDGAAIARWLKEKSP